MAYQDPETQAALAKARQRAFTLLRSLHETEFLELFEAEMKLLGFERAGPRYAGKPAWTRTVAAPRKG